MLLKNFTLLYVEDDMDTQDEIKDILTPYVKELYISNNGEEGLQTYKKFNPDIVLTDVSMPKMNGIKMTQLIKEIDPHQPIIILTAFNEPTYLKQAVNLGIDKYIIKPISNLDLFFQPLESIAKVLQADIDKQHLEHMLQIQSKVSAMGEMLGNIAHQWRQPLSVISTYVSGMKLEVEFGKKITIEDINKCANKIMEQTDYLSHTIDDFRNFFQDSPNDIKEFNIKDTINKVINLIEDSYKVCFITIVSNIDNCILKQNQHQLAQALLNIFNNAKDAFVLNNIKGERYFFIDIQQNNNNLIINFKDNAGGIPENIIDKIFDPYFTTKFEHQGTGIGLYMTNQIIIKHFNGTIKVLNSNYQHNNKNEKGALFTITLPVS